VRVVLLKTVRTKAMPSTTNSQASKETLKREKEKPFSSPSRTPARHGASSTWDGKLMLFPCHKAGVFGVYP